MIYEQAADAERAVRRYNTVQLDGQPMQVRACAGEGGAARQAAARRGRPTAAGPLCACRLRLLLLV